MANFEEKLNAFNSKLHNLLKNNSVPKWFKPFVEVIQTFGKEVRFEFDKLEASSAVQKTVTENLCSDRDLLKASIVSLEEELDDQQQYSRRTCLLIHGVKETPREDTDNIVLGVMDDKLGLKMSINEVTRTHRIGRKRTGEAAKPRPIIARFLSYRQRKAVFDRKKNLKGQGIVITESLTKNRFSLLNSCFQTFDKKNVWTLDGRIYCKPETGEIQVFFSKAQLTDYINNI